MMTLSTEKERSVPQRLTDINRDVAAVRESMDRMEYVWSKNPDRFRCMAISTAITAPKLVEMGQLLEVGCGDKGDDPAGYFDSSYFGVDISLNACRHAKGRNPKANFINADVRYLPIRDGAVQLTVAYEVLGLLGADTYQALREMARTSDGAIKFEVQHRDWLRGRAINGNATAFELDCGIAVAPKKDGKADIRGAFTVLFFDETEMKSVMTNLGFAKVKLIRRKEEGRRIENIDQNDTKTPADSLLVIGMKIRR